jgi:uncharacterized protein GlcG (DUF336 family)
MTHLVATGRRVASVVVMATALAVAACSDDEEDGGSAAVGPDGSPNLPTRDQLKAALDQAQAEDNKGFGLDMWATVVDRSGIVRAIAFTGTKEDDQWPASRVISAQKANTANSLSLTGLALSTANLYTAVQPGGSLFGLQESNPVNTDAAYGGNADDYGTVNDFMIGKRIGGVNVFGGGVALYDASGTVIGAVGVSGDTSCADHSIAWKVRDYLRTGPNSDGAVDYVPSGVDPLDGHDNIVFDIDANGVSASGWGHPVCPLVASEVIAEAQALPTTNPVSTLTP